MQELQIEAKNENLHEVFAFLLSSLSQYAIDKKTLRQVKLCVEEVFENISSYAYDPKTGMIRITVDCIGGEKPQKVVVTFFDHGKPFDPLSYQTPDLDLDLEDRPLGGLGIFLVRQKMDDINYEYRDGENILMIEKNIGSDDM